MIFGSWGTDELQLLARAGLQFGGPAKIHEAFWDPTRPLGPHQFQPRWNCLGRQVGYEADSWSPMQAASDIFEQGRFKQSGGR